MPLSIRSEHITIRVDKTSMDGVLCLPEDHIGIVLFANGSGSNRLKPPNDYVASILCRARIGTLWLDLLSSQEPGGKQVASDIGGMTARLIAACEWLLKSPAASDTPLGLFASSTAAAAALQAAVVRRGAISSVVLRGGRPDMAGIGTLARVNVPTLLIVGSLDDEVVDANRAAYAALRCKKRFEMIPGATHAFDEPGSMEVVARLARNWFLQHAHVAST